MFSTVASLFSMAFISLCIPYKIEQLLLKIFLMSKNFRFGIRKCQLVIKTQTNRNKVLLSACYCLLSTVYCLCYCLPLQVPIYLPPIHFAKVFLQKVTRLSHVHLKYNKRAHFFITILKLQHSSENNAHFLPPFF